jgi:hypothetical protein
MEMTILPCIHALASHIGTLAEMCEVNGVGAKPEDGVWWIHPEGRRIGRVLDWRMLTKQISPDEL